MSDVFWRFITTYEPGGTAGIDCTDGAEYEHDAPYFSYSKKFLPSGHNTLRAWFVKYEFLESNNVARRALKENSYEELISPGKFLLFAKALVNVLTHYKNAGSNSKPLIFALCVIEKSLRDTNKGSNDPINIQGRTFAYADNLVKRLDRVQGTKYDIGLELALIAGMLQQRGYESKNFRFGKRGFNLLQTAFPFRSSITNRKRKKAGLDLEDRVRKDSSVSRRRLSQTDMAIVGAAYQLSKQSSQTNDFIRFIGSAVALSFTSVSMRCGELLGLARDAIYEEDGKTRFRIARPKIATFQDLPLPDELAPLAKECITEVLLRTRDAHEAFCFYDKMSKGDPGRIDQLYIPPRLAPAFKRKFFRRDELWEILELKADYFTQIPPRVNGIQTHYGVEQAGDLHPECARKANIDAIKLSLFVSTCAQAGIQMQSFTRLHLDCYVTRNFAAAQLSGSKKKVQEFLKANFRFERVSAFVRVDDVKRLLLEEFRERLPAHWPYTSKDKTLKVRDALMVMLASNSDPSVRTGSQLPLWWLPICVTTGQVATWIAGPSNQQPILFSHFNMRFEDGNFPRYGIHDARKFHQTEGLLAGVAETSLNLLAGRSNGPQADHYDLRSLKERTKSLPETFDPAVDLNVIGPSADSVPADMPIVERKAFLMKRAAPLQMTELGGCGSDWGVNPCDAIGDCTRCKGLLWIKGDALRLPGIIEIREHSLRMIAIGEEKLARNPGKNSIKSQILQFKEKLDTCEKIIAAENNPAIPLGTIVTFENAPTLMTFSMRSEKLRDESNRGFGS